MNFNIKAYITVLFIACILSVNVMAEEKDCSTCICTGTTTYNSCTDECCKKVKLYISGDGKLIIDQYNNEIAKFSSDIKFKAKQDKSGLQKLPGCMCPSKECIAYDQNNKCVQWYISHTWDFDCNCKK